MILSIKPIKNALMLRLNVAIMKARHSNKGMSRCKNNFNVNRMGLQKETKELAKNTMAQTKMRGLLRL